VLIFWVSSFLVTHFQVVIFLSFWRRRRRRSGIELNWVFWTPQICTSREDVWVFSAVFCFAFFVDKVCCFFYAVFRLEKLLGIRFLSITQYVSLLISALTLTEHHRLGSFMKSTELFDNDHQPPCHVFFSWQWDRDPWEDPNSGSWP
jgi:hypothetical protein